MRAVFIFAGILLSAGSVLAQEPQVVTLTQTPCQFLEVEADQGFTSTRKADCDAINAKTAEARLKVAKVIELKAGDYVFHVINKNVPYELGFWLREQGYDEANTFKRLTMTSVSGGGLTQGSSQDYTVSLKPGAYVYSCPLNTTPTYSLVVTE